MTNVQTLDPLHREAAQGEGTEVFATCSQVTVALVREAERVRVNPVQSDTQLFGISEQVKFTANKE